MSLLYSDPKRPKDWAFVLGFEVCFWILRAASRSRAAVLEGMCRKIAFGDLQGLLTGEVNSKSGDFLRSGVSVREKRQALLQRFLGKFVFGLVDLRFFTCRLVFGEGLFIWVRLSEIYLFRKNGS